MQRELKLTRGFTIDEVTGYIKSQDSRSKVTPAVKALFIKKLAELGDVEETCQAVGISRRVLTPHLRSDSKFRQDYKRTKQNLKEEPARTRTQTVIDRLYGSNRTD